LRQGRRQPDGRLLHPRHRLGTGKVRALTG
jgi:hypothetical protein